MTCKEIHEQITAFVDDRIDEGEYREKVQQHIDFCPDCRAEYEMELLTKLAVQHHAPRVATPESLRRSIASGVEQIESERRAEIESRREPEAEPDWLDRFSSDYLSPVGISLALLLVAIGAWLLFDPFASRDEAPIVEAGSGPPVSLNDTGMASAANFFNKASENFHAILRRQLPVQFESSDPKEVEKFFRDNGVAYNVRFVPVGLPLAGGVVSRHGSTRLAHLVYLNSDTIVYVFEVPVELLDRREVVYVSEDVLKRLRNGERIWETPSTNESTLMLRQDAVVMAVVANLDRPTFERVVPIQ